MIEQIVGEVFIIETIENNKFVKVGEITVTIKEWEECCGMRGFYSLAKEKAREQFKQQLEGKSIVVTHKEYLLK